MSIEENTGKAPEAAPGQEERTLPAAITIEEADSCVLPSACAENDPAPEPFRIADDDVADWAVKKIAEKKAEYERLKELGERETARIAEKVDQARRRYEADSSFLTERLAEYFVQVPHRKTKTTEKYQLLSGSLTLKKGGVEYRRDDARLVAWLKENGRGDFVRVKEEPAWGELKKRIKAVGSAAVIADTGEILDGVEAAQAPDVFRIDV